MRLRILLVAGALSVATLHGQAPASAAAPAGDAARGKTLYLENGCWTCHGYAAHGGAGTGPRLAGRLPSWTVFSTYVRAPAGEMIPYTGKVLNEEDLADIYAWIQSVPPAPPVSSLPPLK
jgi:mono/diheme cytochrome c family protein